MRDEETVDARAYLRVEVRVTGTAAAVRRKLKMSHDAVAQSLMQVDVEGFAVAEYDEKGHMMRQYNQGSLAHYEHPHELNIKETP